MSEVLYHCSASVAPYLIGAMAWRRIDVHRAAERGDVAVIERYLDTGGDVERKDSAFQATPVHWASLVREFLFLCHR